jgi:hypothetical protein
MPGFFVEKANASHAGYCMKGIRDVRRLSAAGEGDEGSKRVGQGRVEGLEGKGL